MKRMRRIMMLVVVCMLLSGLVDFGTVKAQAATQTIVKSRSFYLYEGLDFERQITITVSGTRAKITKLKNYNPKIVKVAADNQEHSYGTTGILRLQPLKAGIAKVTFQYAGKNFVYKIIITKYENLCKQFKVGTTDFTKCFDKSGVYYCYQQKKDITGNLDIRLQNGWKIVKTKVNQWGGGGEIKNVKNHSKITLSTKGTEIFMYVKNVKTGKVEEIVLYYFGNDNQSENSYMY